MFTGNPVVDGIDKVVRIVTWNVLGPDRESGLLDVFATVASWMM